MHGSAFLPHLQGHVSGAANTTCDKINVSKRVETVGCAITQHQSALLFRYGEILSICPCPALKCVT